MQMPFHNLVTELGVDRNSSFNPIFQAAFAFQQAMDGGVKGTSSSPDDLTMEPVDTETTTSVFDLLLEIMPGSDGSLGGSLVYNTDLFSLHTIEMMAGDDRPHRTCCIV
jgi:hypothetical protein